MQSSGPARVKIDRPAFSVGDALEVAVHPSLNSRARLNEIGWDPDADIDFGLFALPFEAGEALTRVGGLRKFDPPNRVKYALADVAPVLVDADRLVLRVAETDYFTVCTIKEALKQDAQLSDLIAADPARNRVPNSLCFHYIARFADGSVLVTGRDRRLRYAGGLWSVSGEEQLSDADVRTAAPLRSWVRRTICEEVFPLRESDLPISERWAIVRPHVERVRIWSVILEVSIGNFALCGLIDFDLTPEEYVRVATELVAAAGGSVDPEGIALVLTTDQMELLRINGHAAARYIFTKEQSQLDVGNAHPTTPYRIYRLLRGLHRAPLSEHSG